jgi:low affinity Fe/Cu permease
MQKKIARFTQFMNWSAKMAGHPLSFAVALVVLSLWLLIGLIFGFDNTWLLIIDTLATINASLMVFIIQNTQIRESKALHLKLDELIRVTKDAEDELMAIEVKEEEELEALRKKFHQKKIAR